MASTIPSVVDHHCVQRREVPPRNWHSFGRAWNTPQEMQGVQNPGKAPGLMIIELV
jgi:hypothetical protein